MLQLQLVNLEADPNLLVEGLKEVLNETNKLQLLPPPNYNPHYKFDEWATNLYERYLKKDYDFSTSYDPLLGTYVVLQAKKAKPKKEFNTPRYKYRSKTYNMSGKPRKERNNKFTGVEPEIIKHLLQLQDNGYSVRKLTLEFEGVTGKKISIQGMHNNLNHYRSVYGVIAQENAQKT